MNIKPLGALLSLAIPLACLFTPTVLFADWTGGIEGGQVLEGDDKGSRVRFKLSNSDRPFSQAFYADWLRGSGSSNSYEAGYTPRFWFSEQAYAFGEGSLKTSKSLNIDRQTKLMAGVGIQLINTATQSFFAEVGGGQVSTKSDIVLIGEETTVTTSLATARVGLSQTLSDLIKLEFDGDYSTAEDLVTTTAEAGISLRITGGAIKYSYRIRGRKDGDNESTDVTDSSISFNYGF